MMNDLHNEQDAAFAKALHDMVEQVTPDAAFASQLEAQLRARAAEKRADVSSSVHVRVRPRVLHLRTLGVAAAAVLALLLLTLTVPPLRTLAQDLLNLLFNRTDSNTLVYETPVSYDIQPTAVGSSIYSPSTSVEAAESQAGFDIRVPALLPDGYVLVDVSYDVVAQQTSLFYMRSGIGLVIVQIPSASAYPLNVGASANIVRVSIGGSIGQYVEGNWIVNPRIEGTTATVSESSWDSDFPFQQLRWEQEGFVFWMMSVAGQHSDLTLDDWVQIAESLR
ncbi:MAG: hypothetical protein U0694_06950 [Anaerolineae bacterium]